MDHYAKALTEMCLRAAITVPSGASDELMHALHKSGVRVVTLGRMSDEARFLSVSTDNSFNHYALGAVVDWVHRVIGRYLTTRLRGVVSEVTS